MILSGDRRAALLALAMTPALAVSVALVQAAGAAEHPTAEHVKFPPFNSENFASQIFWLVLSFILIYVLIKDVVVPRVAEIREARRAAISEDLVEAKRLKNGSELMAMVQEKVLRESRAKAQELEHEARGKGKAMIERELKDLDKDLAVRVDEAQRLALGERRSGMRNVRAIAAEAAGAIVERLTGSAPSNAEARAVVDQVRDARKR